MGIDSGNLRGALALVSDLEANGRDDPFPVHILERLGALVGAECVSYWEKPDGTCDGGRFVVTNPYPEELEEVLGAHCHEVPLSWSVPRREEAATFSDVTSWRQFRRTGLYTEVHRPLGLADSLFLYLAPVDGVMPHFAFDRAGWGFSRRDRDLLEALIPYLVRARARWASHRPAALTRRERQVLDLASQGATNTQIAWKLELSEHTVRTHLNRVYRKLGAHSRTHAAALVSGLGL